MDVDSGARHTQSRVMIFDQDKDWCAKLCSLLRDGGFYCEPESESFSTCAVKAQSSHFHYVVVNYHSLTRPKEELLSFKSEFPTTQIILLGEHDDPEMVEYQWPPNPIVHYNYGGKDDRPLTDLRKLIAQCDSVRRKTGNVGVHFAESVKTLLDDYSKYHSVTRTEEQRNRRQVSLGIMEEELRAVVESLFSSSRTDRAPIAKEIAVEPFAETGKSGSCMLKLTPQIGLAPRKCASAG